jgi:ankyrin repeat protein
MVSSPQTDAFFNAVRSSDVAAVRALLADEPTLAKARWPGRSGDGRMRSLGPSPFNTHAWLSVPPDHNPDDPRFTSTPLIYSRNDEIVAMLVESAADVNAEGTCGDIELADWFHTPLWRAAHDGRIESVRRLVEYGANVNFRTPDGANQAMKAAAENEHPDVCDYLLEKGARPDVVTAAMLGMSDYVKDLIAADAEAVSVCDAHGRTPLDAATLLDTFRVAAEGLGPHHDRTAEILILHGALMNISHAAALGRLEDVQLRVERDKDVLRRPVELLALVGGAAIFESPLRAARRRGSRDVEAYLLEHGAVDEPKVIWR